MSIGTQKSDFQSVYETQKVDNLGIMYFVHYTSCILLACFVLVFRQKYENLGTLQIWSSKFPKSYFKFIYCISTLAWITKIHAKKNLLKIL